MGAARKLEYEYEDVYINYEREELENRRRMKRRMANIRAQRKKRRRNVMRALLSMIAVFLLVITQSRQERIAALNLEVENLNDIINDMEKDKLSLITKVEIKKSDIDIVHEAQTKLGMTFPTEEQKVYFTVNRDKERNDNQGVMTKVYSIFTGKAAQGD